MELSQIMLRLRSLGGSKSVAGMARVGIDPERALGVSIPDLRRLAREIGRDHLLAGELFAAGLRETMILASMVDDPGQLTSGQMENWAAEFYDWEVCDQSCANLFEKNILAWSKAVEWSERREEFVKRAGFVLMARLAVSDKKAADDAFRPFFPLIVREAVDERNMVKKAVNWALRQIGKRNLVLNAEAVRTSQTILALDSRSARWIANDALRELTGAPVLARLEKKAAAK